MLVVAASLQLFLKVCLQTFGKPAAGSVGELLLLSYASCRYTIQGQGLGSWWEDQLNYLRLLSGVRFF